MRYSTSGPLTKPAPSTNMRFMGEAMDLTRFIKATLPALCICESSESTAMPTDMEEATVEMPAIIVLRLADAAALHNSTHAYVHKADDT
jgi:hypothetical protein